MDNNINETERSDKDNEMEHISVETNNNFEPTKETGSSGGGDMESTQSEGAKTAESREERIKRLKDKSEAERQRKYTEILESQRVSNELRQKQQEDRRKKIEELKQREEERKKKVEQRRLEMDAKEKEKNEGLLRRTKEREARAAILQKQIRMMPTMTQSMTSSFQNRMTTSLHSSGASSGSEKCKESVSPRPQNRSSSRLTTSKNNRVPQQSTPRSVTATPSDQALYDRLSKPRSGSQPPKNRSLKESIDNSPRNMSSSFIKQPIKTTPRAPASTNKTIPCITPDKKPTPTVIEKKTLPPTTEKKSTPTVVDKKPTTLPTSEIKPVMTLKTEKKPSPQKRKSLPTSGDSGLTASPVSEMEPVVENSKDISDLSEVRSTSKTDEVSQVKVNARKQSKNLSNKEPESISNNEATVESKNNTINEEEMYRLKLAEQRRLAREAKEKQQEEQRKIEEEAKQKAAAEKKRIEEETRLLIEEEARRRKQMEEEEEAEVERQRVEEEMERVKKEELEREMEETRLKKSRTDDSDRMERKRRLEKIMSRVKKADESSSFSNEESNAATSELFESSIMGDQSNDQILEISLDKGIIKEENVIECEEPMEAWTEEKEKEDVVCSHDIVLEANEEDSMSRPEEHINDSPSLISDNVLNLPGPQSLSQSQVTSVSESLPLNNEQAPQFKSRLLQSMMASGRLANNDSRRNSLLMTSTPSLSDGTLANKRQSLILAPVNGDLDTPDFMSHSRSYNNDMCKMSVSMVDCGAQSRNGLSHESQPHDDGLTNGNQHSDTDNEATLSTFNSNRDHPQLPPDSHLPDRGTDLHSDSSCSRLVTEERPSAVPSRPLESS